MIKSATVREIIETARVEDVVGEFVNLRRRGSNMIGLCPFHNEKTPSFNVNPARNIYKCFGCGRGGDPVNFLMEHEHLSFPEALRWLARHYGIEIEEVELTPEQAAEQQLADSLYITNEFARDYFQRQLFDTDRGRSVGLSYFKKRGFREETIRKFGLGYAPRGGTDLLQAAELAGHKRDMLEQAGLTKNGRDFFRDRVQFAIHNLSGKVIGFGGRILQQNVKAPKYINTPETEIYNKSKVLYGIYFAKQAIRREDECILTEGYTDVISLHQAGIENVVASSGTALTTEQIRLIKRYTPNVRILFDGDSAGIRAALRGVDLLLEQDLNVKVVLLPDGEDPDSYLQKVGTTVFRDYLKEKGEDFIFFKANLLLADAGNDPVKQTALIKDIVGSIARIPDPLKRSIYVKECARLFGVEEDLLVAEINKSVATQLKKHQPAAEAPPPRPAGPDVPPVAEEATASGAVLGDEYQERDLARILITAGHQLFDPKARLTVAEFVIQNIGDVIDEFDHALYQRVVKECSVLLNRNEAPNTDYFLQHETPELRQLAIDFLSTPYAYSENWEKKWEVVLNQKDPEENFQLDSAQALKRFRLRKVNRLMAQNVDTIRNLTGDGEQEDLLLHLKLHQRLQEIRNKLAQELGTVYL
ncbi:MAG: DNA primase [Lewinella sp.]|nr:DNA primase [Lewinella sp.]